MPRDITSAFRDLIDKLKYDKSEGSEPKWRLDVLDLTPESGIRIGSLVTDNEDEDYKPAVIMSSQTNKFYAVFVKNGYIYGSVGEEDEYGEIIWSDEEQLFEGDEPDLEFYGTFTVEGKYNTTDLMIVYEKAGTIYFRKADVDTGGWQALIDAEERTVKTGSDPTIVRAWADPPEVGDNDLGIYVFYINSGKLMFTFSTDLGISWKESVEINKPSGGTKGNPKAFRESSYKIACVYEYNDGTKTDIYYILSQESIYVNIAAPEETYRIAVTGLSFEVMDVLLSYSAPDETYRIQMNNLEKNEYEPIFADVSDETYKILVSNLNMQFYTGDKP